MALAGLFVLITDVRFVRMVGSFATSLLCLILGALWLRKQPRGGITPEASGIARAGAVSVAAGFVILMSGVVISRWIGPTAVEFIEQENTRNAAAAWCRAPEMNGHVVGDICRRQGENVFRLPPAPIDWTMDEEDG